MPSPPPSLALPPIMLKQHTMGGTNELQYRKHSQTDNITSHHITSHHITAHHITSHHITSHHITSHHITSHHITSHHITSHHITAHHITSHHITNGHKFDHELNSHTFACDDNTTLALELMSTSCGLNRGIRNIILMSCHTSCFPCFHQLIL